MAPRDETLCLNLTNKRPDSLDIDFMILVARNPVPLLHGTYRLAQFLAEYCAKWIISRRWKGNVTVIAEVGGRHH